MELDELSHLAIKHWTDKFGAHLYTPIYHELFRGYRDQPIRLLEIGVGGYGNAAEGGESLRMWAEYFPNATIVGLDIAEKRIEVPDSVAVVLGDQRDEEFLRELNTEHGPFDIIIDDGSHTPSDVIASFYALYPIMHPRGLYIVEDVQSAFWPSWGGNVEARGTIVDTALDVIRSMHRLEVMADGHTPPAQDTYGEITEAVWFWRNLVVFARGDNTYPSNRRFDYEHPLVKEIYRENIRRP